MTPPEGEQGFALVEACAALGVLAIVSAMFVGVMHSAALARGHAAQTRSATLIARSQLALAAENSQGGESGRSGSFSWRVAVGGYPSADGTRGLEQVTVRVTDQTRRAAPVELRTLRIAR